MIFLHLKPVFSYVKICERAISQSADTTRAAAKRREKPAGGEGGGALPRKAQAAVGLCRTWGGAG